MQIRATPEQSMLMGGQLPSKAHSVPRSAARQGRAESPRARKSPHSLACALALFSPPPLSCSESYGNQDTGREVSMIFLIEHANACRGERPCQQR